MKERVKAFHRKRPYVDPLVNNFTGAILGLIISDIRQKVQSGSNLYDLRTIGPALFWLLLILLYFAFFSSYATGRYGDKVKEALEKKTVEAIEHIDPDNPEKIYEVAVKWHDSFEKIS